MIPRLANKVRIEQTRREFEAMRREINTWVAKRQKKDLLGQFHTQLKMLGGVMTDVIERIGAELDAVADDRNRGAVYADCRRCDRRVVWLRRLFDYFRKKFDQREDSALASVLAAADEVVWSCFAEVFRNAELPIPPAPLAYIEPVYSPQAMPRLDPPPDLRADVDAEFLVKCLNQLPISLVSLPPACVLDPWWLVYVGHEVGHHVQYELRPDWRLVGEFGAYVNAAAMNEPEPKCDEDGAARWQRWSQEIFADSFSVHAMGHAALWAMAEFETGEEPSMLRERRGAKSAYPSAAVRIAFMTEVAAGLGLAAAAPTGFNITTSGGAPVMENKFDLRAVAAADLAVTPKLAKAVRSYTNDGAGTMARLCAWNAGEFSPVGSVHQWAEALRGKQALTPEKTLRAARLATGGAIVAWRQAMDIADNAERADEREKLKANLLDVLPKSREEGTRAAAPLPAQTVGKLGGALANLIFSQPDSADTANPLQS